MTTSMPTHAHELYERARRSLARGVSSSFRAAVKPEPLFVDYGRGAYLVDADGIQYLDFTLAWGPLILGHSHPAINTAVQAQLARGCTFGAQHALEIRVAERIQAAVPCADLITFSNSGSEAVLVALRLARAYTGRSRILKFEGHYHGWTDGVLISYHPSLAEAGPYDAPRLVPGTQGQSLMALSDVLVLPWNNLEALERALQQNGTELAAVIMEPVMCNSGMVEPASGYLEAVRAMTEYYGVLLIFDEVITGFRIALGGAQEVYGVKPDIAVYAKAVAGGFPLSVIAGQQAVMDLISNGTVQHSGTYNGNPISLAAAEATLEQLSQPGVYEHLNTLGYSLAHGARAILTRYQLAAKIHQVGPMMQILFTEQQKIDDYRAVAACNATVSDALVQELRAQGVLVLPDGRWYLSAVHTDEDVQAALLALERSLAKIVTA
ncbi:MAG TPA: aspartate aminotransferase family protein [Ktedonobacteraceae bacterium]|nr:aspartate aminotransferase family protein [Ktedonobacteraceae bacterium]